MVQPRKKYMGDDERSADLYTDKLSDVPSGCEVDISDHESDSGSDFGPVTLTGRRKWPRVLVSFSDSVDGDINIDSLAGMDTDNGFTKDDPLRSLEPVEGMKGLTYIPQVFLRL
jgi:hypothetical protein